MFILENIGKEMSKFGSIKPEERKEDFKPEEPRLLLKHQDLLINLDHPSDAQLSGIVTDPDLVEDSLLLKSKLQVLEFNSLNPLESQLISEEKIEVKKDSMPTRLDLLTISANLFSTPDMRKNQSQKLRLASSMTHQK